jgi:hypothetical protein
MLSRARCDGAAHEKPHRVVQDTQLSATQLSPTQCDVTTTEVPTDTR